MYSVVSQRSLLVAGNDLFPWLLRLPSSFLNHISMYLNTCIYLFSMTNPLRNSARQARPSCVEDLDISFCVSFIY